MTYKMLHQIFAEVDRVAAEGVHAKPACLDECLIGFGSNSLWLNLRGFDMMPLHGADSPEELRQRAVEICQWAEAAGIERAEWLAQVERDKLKATP